jgi:iron(III) transport system ATP-binding protein
METGRIVQLDTAETLYRHPASAFVAGFIGRANLLHATVYSVNTDQVILDIGGQKFPANAKDAPAPGSPVGVVIRPEAIAIETANTGLTGVVQVRTYLGDKIEYEVAFGGQTLHIVRFNPAEEEEFLSGASVFISIPSANVRLVAAS